MDAAGVAQRGVLLRHLVMPDNASSTDRFVRWVADELSPRTYTNIMGQWTPMYRAHEYPEIDRRVTPAEYEQALRWAREAGLTRLDEA
jgi:putative pyruvate formate lyase activating enzyme